MTKIFFGGRDFLKANEAFTYSNNHNKVLALIAKPKDMEKLYHLSQYCTHFQNLKIFHGTMKHVVTFFSQVMIMQKYKVY